MGLLVVLAITGVSAWVLSATWPDAGVPFTLAAAGLALWLVHRLLTYGESRGWIYYRKGRGSHGGLGVTSDFLNMYDPSRKHMQQAVREAEWKRDEDDDGKSGGPCSGGVTLPIADRPIE